MHKTDKRSEKDSWKGKIRWKKINKVHDVESACKQVSKQESMYYCQMATINES